MVIMRALCLAAMMGFPGAVWAFGDCAAPGYLAAFGEPGGAEPCDLRHEQTLSVNGRPFDFRVISLTSVPHGDDAEWVTSISSAMTRLAQVAESMGPSIRVPNMTILLTDRTHSSGGFEIHGERTTTRIPGECPIAVYKVHDEVATSDFAFTFVHEAFHCIQDWTWPTQSASSAADWWAEGSADYFAQMVLPGVSRLEGNYALYGERLMESPPYDEGHDYENVVFFDWLNSAVGPNGVADFIASMPPGGGYLPALQAQLSLTQWTEFTESYLHGFLAEPNGGGDIPAPAVTMEAIVTEEEGALDLSTDAFRHFRIDVVFPAGGRYEVSVDSSADLRSKISIGDDVWLEMPVQIMTCGEGIRTTIYGVTTTGPQDFTINYRRLGECGDCQDVSTQDACLVGEWTMTGGGPVEWMRANGLPANISVDVSAMSLRFLRGGDFTVAPIDVSVAADSDGMAVTGTGTNRDSGGRWSSSDGRLFICPYTGEISATVRIEDAPPSILLFGPGDAISLGYTCHGNTMETLIDIPRMPPMSATYTRQ